jgi:hypothetical protein
MMTAEQHQWDRLRDQAQSYLPKDFARQVVHRAQSRKKTSRREYLLIAITAGCCLMSVAVGNWYLGNRIQDRNVALWKITAAQIRALRTSI